MSYNIIKGRNTLYICDTESAFRSLEAAYGRFIFLSEGSDNLSAPMRLDIT